MPPDRRGKFDLIASHSGYVRAAFQEHDGDVATAIVTGNGLVTTGLRFELAPQATIYGTVTEDSGDPVPMARPSIFTTGISSAAVPVRKHSSALNRS